ncbi:MAG: hypothetical protein RL215_997, partial [Planctomycetota bacterium]
MQSQSAGVVTVQSSFTQRRATVGRFGGVGFGPRKTQKDAELEDRVRGRGAIEAGVAEAAWRCPVIGV